MINAGVFIISDAVLRGECNDLSGPIITALLEKIEANVSHYEVLPDNLDCISGKLLDHTNFCDLIITCGGTGISPKDYTPEATTAIADKDLPGFGELIRRKGCDVTPYAMISRAQAVVCRRSLIINLPGNHDAARESLEAVLPAVRHTVEMIKSDIED